MSFYTDFKDEFRTEFYRYKNGNKVIRSREAVDLISKGNTVNAVSVNKKRLKLSTVSSKLDDFSETFVNKVKNEKYNVTFVTEQAYNEEYPHVEYVRLSVSISKFLKMASNALGVSLSDVQLLKLQIELNRKYHKIFFGGKVACYWRVDNSRVYFDERIIRIVRDAMNEFKMFETSQSIGDVAINSWKKYSASEIEDPRNTFVRLVGNQINTVFQTPGLVESMMASSEVSQAIFSGGVTSFTLSTYNTTNEPYEVREELDAYYTDYSKTYKRISILIHSTSNKEGYVEHVIQGNEHYYNYHPYFTNSDDVLKNTKRISVNFWIGRDKKSGKYKLSSHVETQVEGNSVEGPLSLWGRENWYTPWAEPSITLTGGLYFSLSADIDRKFVNAGILNLFKSPESVRFDENSILPSNFSGSILNDPNFSTWASKAKTLEVYTKIESKKLDLLPMARKYTNQSEEWDNTEEPDDDDVQDGTDGTEEEGGDTDPEDPEDDEGDTDDDNPFKDETFSGYFMNTYFIDDLNLSKFSTFLNDKSIWESVLTALKGDNTDSLISIHVLPVHPQLSASSEKVCMGPFTISYASAKKITERFLEKDFGSVNIGKYFNDARDYTMTKFRLFLPFFGFADLDAYDLIDSTVRLTCKIDVFTGDGVYFVNVERGGMNSQLYSFQFNCKLDIPFSSAKRDIGSALVGMGGAMMLSVATSNPAPMGASAVTGAMQAAKQEFRHSSSYNANAGWLGNMRPFFIVNRPVHGEAYEFEKFQGVATNKTVYLKNLSGFTKVKEIHLEKMGNATESEIAEIVSLLQDGVVF